MTIRDLPTLNALLNMCAGIFLLLGWGAIKRGLQDWHKRFMITALIFSTLFMISYIYYHTNVIVITRYEGEGIWRLIYFAVLIPHVILAVGIIPFVFAAVWFAAHQQFDKHVRITRYLWPVWMYVSVTGVVVYVMLYIL